ncbi:MAG: SelT/SelW/SelH family protein [Planctomycetes bacterium]|nr:SelT/SelW/SelH family protein [Planctomycetota bacterium]
MEKYNHRIENLTLVPADGGRFEVSLNGAEVFNKKLAGRFPEVSEITNQLDTRLLAPAEAS